MQTTAQGTNPRQSTSRQYIDAITYTPSQLQTTSSTLSSEIAFRSSDEVSNSHSQTPTHRGSSSSNDSSSPDSCGFSCSGSSTTGITGNSSITSHSNSWSSATSDQDDTHKRATFTMDRLKVALSSNDDSTIVPQRADSLPLPERSRPPQLPPSSSKSVPISCSATPSSSHQIPVILDSPHASARPLQSHSLHFSSQPLPPLMPSDGKALAQSITPHQLLPMLERDTTLVIDVRNLTSYLGDGRLRKSINVSFPTLLIKRFHKGNYSSFALSSFVTTELGKSILREQEGQFTETVVVDDRQETRDPASLSPGSVLLTVLERRKDYGAIWFLDRPLLDAVQQEPGLKSWLIQGEEPFEANGSHAIADIGPSFGGLRTNSSPPVIPSLPDTPASESEYGTAPIMSPRTPGGTSRPRGPRLRRIDTSENLLGPPKGTLGSSLSRSNSRSPNTQPGTRAATDPSSAAPTLSLQSLCNIQSRSPAATATRFAEADLKLPRDHYRGLSSSTSSASPEEAQNEATTPAFDVSTIIPGFLFLGPEPTCSADLDELESLGVKSVLNLALECEDKDGDIARRFDLRKIPMRDFVEETGVQQAIEEACKIINEAQLQSRPVFCHCRAGKSRSVTIVLAYLVHRNHWSLKRAYAHVRERRAGISPNLGFLAELMTWEEREGGRRSAGVYGSPVAGTNRHTNSVKEGRSGEVLAGNGTAQRSSHKVTAPSIMMTRTHSDQGVTLKLTNSTLASPTTANPRHTAYHLTNSLTSSPSRHKSSAPSAEEDSLTRLTGRPRHRHRHDAERQPGTEVRAQDGTWTAARPEEHDEWSMARRRASRAGLESVRALLDDDDDDDGGGGGPPYDGHQPGVTPA